MVGQIVRIDLAGELTREVVADGGREEPHAHHLADEARRRELGHRAQADRAQTQLAERVQQIGRARARSAAPCRPSTT